MQGQHRDGWHQGGQSLNPSERTGLRFLVTRAHLGGLPLRSTAAVAEDLVGDHAPLVLNDLGQDTRKGEDVLPFPIAGGRHGPRTLDAAEQFVRNAELETARSSAAYTEVNEE